MWKEEEISVQAWEEFMYYLIPHQPPTSTAARRRLCLGPQLVTVTVFASASATQSVNLEQNDRALVKINLFIA